MQDNTTIWVFEKMIVVLDPLRGKLMPGTVLQTGQDQLSNHSATIHDPSKNPNLERLPARPHTPPRLPAHEASNEF